MFHKILCMTDLTQASHQAVRIAARLARDVDAELVLAHVCHDPALAYASDYQLTPVTIDKVQADAKGAIEAVSAEAIGLGATRTSTRVVAGIPSEQIVAIAQDPTFDLIVVGTHARTGVGRFLFGSVAEMVVRHAPCSVLVARGEAGPFRRVVCSFDFSDASHEALHLAGELARDALTLVHAVELPPWYSSEPTIVRFLDKLDHRAAQLLEIAVKEVEQQTKAHVSSRARFGGVASQVLAIVANDPEVDLVVVGSHGHAGIRHALVGSVAGELIRHARCSVLVARSRTTHANERSHAA